MTPGSNPGAPKIKVLVRDEGAGRLDSTCGEQGRTIPSGPNDTKIASNRGVFAFRDAIDTQYIMEYSLNKIKRVP